MLNNIGLPGLTMIFVLAVVGLAIWLVARSSRRKAKDQARIADALEELARAKTGNDRSG